MPKPPQSAKNAAKSRLKALLGVSEEPAVNRIDMSYKDVTKRVPELTEGAQAVSRTKIKDLIKKVLNEQGSYEAKRLERAADEVPNLESLYQQEALERLFRGDNAKALMTMNPKDFEKYSHPLDPRLMDENATRYSKTGERMSYPDYMSKYLSNVGAFSDVPFLEINKQKQGSKSAPFISGHEGRHRNRVMVDKGEKAGLVQLLPRSELREPFPRRSREDYIEALQKELDITNRMVLPERFQDEAGSIRSRPAIQLPKIYAEGGEVHSDVEMAGGGAIKPWAGKGGGNPEKDDIWSKALPMEGRLTFLPARVTPEGKEWAVPGALAAAWNAFTAPRRAIEGKLEDPVEEALNVAGMAMTGAMPFGAPAGSLGMNVWHGSPHKFDKFDSSKIGTGEGAQAYGHGLYVAERPVTAKTYQQQLSTGVRGFHIDGRTPDVKEMSLVEGLMNRLSKGMDEQTALQDMRKEALIGIEKARTNLAEVKNNLGKTVDLGEGWGKLRQFTYTNDDLVQAQKSLNSLTEYANRVANLKPGQITKNPGSLYKVDLPDTAIAKMLDWDKPISAQPEIMKKIPPKLLAEIKKDHATDNANIIKNYFQGNAEAAFYGSEFYSRLAKKMNKPAKMSLFGQGALGVRGDKVASKYLNSIGIPGIRYLDSGSRGAGQGTSNFVIFPGNEDLLTIIERNNEKILKKAAGGSVEQKYAGGGALKDGDVKMGRGGPTPAAKSAIKRKLKSLLGMADEASDIKPIRKLSESESVTAAQRAEAGRRAADVTKATAPMRMSEALGSMNVEGKGALRVTQSDRSRVGGGNIGGAMFPGLQQVDPFYEGAVWGVGKKPTASGLINQSDENTLWSTLLGSADQLKTNPIVFNKLRRGFTDAMKAGKLSDELADKINHNLALKFGEGADIRDPKIWLKADTFDKRALLADLMMGQGIAPNKGGVALGGEKSGKGVIFQPSEILKKETEPLLLHPEYGGDVPTFAVGPRLFSLSGDVKNRPDLHPGFPYILQGEDKGVVFRPAPGEVAMREYVKRFKEKNKRNPGYYDWTLGEKGVGLPSQPITEEYLTYLQKAGYKKGGPVGALSKANR